MIKTETVTIDGSQFRRTYSDLGLVIIHDGISYSEAVDPLGADRVYTEGTTVAAEEDFPAKVLGYIAEMQGEVAGLGEAFDAIVEGL